MEVEEELLLLPVIQQHHPTHHHPLQLLHYSTNNSSISPICLLCHRKTSTTAEAYTCKEGCDTDIYYHRLCVEAPPQIDLHPLHPQHPLCLVHDRAYFSCHACDEYFYSTVSSFWCHECDFHLDIACALSMLSDEGGYRCGKTSEQITLLLHPHPLTSFSKRHDFVKENDCYICKSSVEEDGYFCLRRNCGFVIHKECIRDVYYADGTKAPRIYHGHPMETFIEEDTGSSRRCASCGSEKSGEFIGCETCRVFYHRNCFQIPEILQYPSHHHHHPDLTLSLSLNTDIEGECQSCSINLKNEIHYCCTLREFFVHIGCALQVLSYYEQGMSLQIELSWHKHPLFLRRLTESASEDCDYCGDESIGPTYVCKEKDCRFILHKRCIEIESTITHPHHLDHPLTLCERDDHDFYYCNACFGANKGLRFFCKLCDVEVDLKCAARFPTHKHYLHEHMLLRFEKIQLLLCHRCRTINDSPIFRCVACNFNLHEDCMELPQVITNDKIHWHPLTLHETFLEDDSGEYYCEHCEKTRDPRLGVYVCGQCKISVPRIYHIHCVLPELGELCEKKRLCSDFQKLKEEIAAKEEEIRAMEKKLNEEIQMQTQKIEKARQELDVLKMEHDQILLDDW